MNFSDIQAALTDGEKMLLHRFDELNSRAESGSAAFSQFLSPRESFILMSLRSAAAEHTFSELSGGELGHFEFFWGGFPGAERTVYCALPAYFAYSLPAPELSVAENPDTELSDAESTERLLTRDEISSLLSAAATDELHGIFRPLRIKSSGYTSLSHRDYLGALVGLGIDRSALGDILVDDGGAYIFCMNSVAELIKNELSGVGRDTVKVIEAGDSKAAIGAFRRDFEAVSGTVASARLDAVVSELARTSRENAKELIRRGLVEHNYFTAADCDADVSAGDVISVKRDGKIRFGKYIIDSSGLLTQKGRIRLSARKYI